MNDKAVNIALHNGLNECLQSLQKTNPKLFLAPSELKKTEREFIFVPTFASALSSLVLNCNDTGTQKKCFDIDHIIGMKFTGESDDINKSMKYFTQTELTSFIEESVRRSLKSRDEERKQEANENNILSKQASKRIVKDQFIDRNKFDSSSQSTTHCDFEEFLNERDLDHNGGGVLDSMSNCSLSSDSSSDHDDMKSSFSLSQSYDSEGTEAAEAQSQQIQIVSFDDASTTFE